MCSSSSMLSISLCLLVCLPPCLSSEVTVKPGEDATLPCRVPRHTAVMWTKLDLGSRRRYVYFYRDNRLYENYQHLSYRGRVKLKDPKKKGGDVSLILKNVNVNDAGRYQCHVGVTRSKTKLNSIVHLKVTDSGDIEEHTGGKERGYKERGYKERGYTEGGDTEGGDKERGYTEGGDTEGGDTEGGDTEGGDKERGYTEGGEKEKADKGGGDKDLQIGLGVGLPAAFLLVVVVVVVGFIIHRKRTEKGSPPADYTAAKTDPPADPEKTQLSSLDP